MQLLLKRLIYALMNGTMSLGMPLKTPVRIAPILQRHYTAMTSDWVLFEDRFQKRCGAVLHDFIAVGGEGAELLTGFLMQPRVLELEIFEEITLYMILSILPLDVVLVYLNLLALWYYIKVSKNNSWMALLQAYCENLYSSDSKVALEAAGDAMIKKVLGRIHALL